MAFELPSRELINSEIVLLNEELETLSSEATAHGLKPVSPELLLSLDDGHSRPQFTTTPANFWNHHVGGPLSTVDVQMYLLEETGHADAKIVSTLQGRLYHLAREWSAHPSNSDCVNRGSTNAFLNAGFAFDWMESPLLTRKLKKQVSDLGDLYTLRQGDQPLNFTHILEKRAEASRAYLLCSK